MKKIIIIVTFVLSLLFLYNFVYAEEEITLSTYYPAPYGEYKKLSVGDTYTAPTDAGIDLVVKGNVGIGTTTPLDELQIFGKYMTQSQGIRLSAQYRAESESDTKLSKISFYKHAVDGTQGFETIKIYNVATYANHGYGGSDLRFAFDDPTDGTLGVVTDRVTFTAFGNVGIGTPSPQENLDVSATQPDIALTWTDPAQFGRLIFYENATLKGIVQTIGSNLSDANRRNDIEIGWNNGGDITFWPNRSQTVTFKADGNVGIGTTAPTVALEVSRPGIVADAQKTVMVYQDSTAPATENWIAMRAGMFTPWIGWRGSDLSFVNESSKDTPWPTGSVKMVIKSETGNVGIGTTTPANKLDVVESGTTGTRPSFSNSLFRVNSDFTDTGTTGVYTYTLAKLVSTATFGTAANKTEVGLNVDVSGAGAGTKYAALFSGGNVGIGTPTPEYELDVSGDIRATGSVYASDYPGPADYVFGPDYKLESIEGHAEFMWKEKHLKAVPQAEVAKDGKPVINMGKQISGLLEELEKAHIYIAQLNERVKELEKNKK